MTEISRQWLREDDVVRLLVEFLREENFEIRSQAPGTKTGDDRVARSSNGCVKRPFSQDTRRSRSVHPFSGLA